MKTLAARFLITITVGLCEFLVSSAPAQLVAISFSGPIGSSGGGSNVYGWSFTTQTAIKVSALGLYDNPSSFDGGFYGDGFAGSHAIGLWDSMNPATPLVTTLIPAGTGAELINGFRYVNINSVNLAAGRAYVVAAAYRSEDNVVGQVNNPALVISASPDIILGDYRFGSDAMTLVFPENSEPGPLSGFGPNFRYTPFTPVPEVSPLPFCVIGLLILAVKPLRSVLRARSCSDR